MARRLVERVFDPRLELIVRKEFIANGHKFKPGDIFQGAALDKQRRVRQLYDSGHLGHERDHSPRRPVVQLGLDLDHPKPALEKMSMQDLRAIAKIEGASLKISKAEQISSILENRKENGD